MGGRIALEVGKQNPNCKIVLTCPAGIVQKKQWGSKILANTKLGPIIMESFMTKNTILWNMSKLKNDRILDLLRHLITDDQKKFSRVQIGIMR